MTEKEELKLLEFCGFTFSTRDDMEVCYYPNGRIYYQLYKPIHPSNLPERTIDTLFEYFIPAWNEKNPGRVISHIEFFFLPIPENPVLCFIWLKRKELEPTPKDMVEVHGETPQEAFIRACLKLIEGE